MQRSRLADHRRKPEVKRHIQRYPPRPCTLPWEKLSGKPSTCNILFRWHTGGQHVKSRNYSGTVWKPALVKAGLIPEPATDRRGRRRYVTTRKEGIHQLRHYYASVMLAGGVSIKELAEYLGHKDPAFTLRVYAHMLPSSQDGARRHRPAVCREHRALTLKCQRCSRALFMITEQRRNRSGFSTAGGTVCCSQVPSCYEGEAGFGQVREPSLSPSGSGGP
jgi:hypothetical protein